MKAFDGTINPAHAGKAASSFVWVISTIFFACASIALAVALAVTYTQKSSDSTPYCGDDLRASISTQAGQNIYTFTDMELRTSIFNDLSKDEIQAISTKLLSITALNLVDAVNADISNNYIEAIELLPPAKDDAVAYLDGTTNTAPGRYARVTIYNGNATTPNAVEYKVGPLPISTNFAYTAIAGRNNIPFNMRYVGSKEYDAIDTVVAQACVDLNTLLVESYDATYGENCDSKCLTYTDTSPRGNNRNERQTWFWFVRDVHGKYAQPVGLEMLVDHSGTDPSAFHLVKVVYHGQSFDNTTALMAAYNSGASTFKKVVLVNNEDINLATSTTRRGAIRALEHLPPPVLVEPAGRRFAVQDHHVYWGGWSFQYGSRPSSGLNLWDIRFRGERIAYEIGLQEALATYGGYHAYQARTIYFDTAWSMGSSAYELMPGIDCPEHAYFADQIMYDNAASSRVMRLKNSVCIFEHNAAMPLRRHYDNDASGGFYFYGGVAANQLIVRTINAVYNYDYTYDYIFHLNGGVEIRVATSGYLQASYWSEKDAAQLDNYGYRILNYTGGSVHDHIIHYKIDLDVAGRSNSFQTMYIDTETRNDLPWFDYQPHEQRKVTRQYIANEDDSRMVYNMMRPSSWLIVNKNSLNKWGVPRSYRVSSNAMTLSLLAAKNSTQYKSASWAKYHFAVSRQKDSEQYSTLVYDQSVPSDPVLTFDSFFNTESLDQQDLVAWASLGVQHVPHSEDMPNTATPGNHGSIFIRPFNYFDEDPSMDLYQSVNVLPLDQRGVQTVRSNFVSTNANKCVLKQTPITYYGYVDSE